MTSITIDEYKFELLHNYIDAKNRHYIKIESTHNDKFSTETFYLYRSNSEGGIWRFCIKESSGHLVKGVDDLYDYVTITFVHIELQMFINNNYFKLPTTKINGPICMYDGVGSLRYNKIYSEIFDKKRLTSPSLFEPLKEITCGSFLDNKVFIQDEYKKKLIENLESTDPYSLYYSLILNKSGALKNVAFAGKMNTIVHTMYNKSITSQYLIFFLGRDSNSYKRLGKNTFKYGNISINYTFYSIYVETRPELVKKFNLSSQRFKVIFAEYEYTNNANPKYNGNYNIILNIIPTVNGVSVPINKYGVYQKVVIAGHIICKPIEYKYHSNNLTDQNGRTIDINYNFVGDIMNNLWFYSDEKFDIKDAEMLAKKIFDNKLNIKKKFVPMSSKAQPAEKDFALRILAGLPAIKKAVPHKKTGGYYEKYIKYKTKYNNLKAKMDQ